MNQPPRHPITITDLQAITHSGMCDLDLSLRTRLADGVLDFEEPAS